MNTISEKDFITVVSTGVTLVDFYAVWCKPCSNLMTVIERMVEPKFDTVQFVKIDIEENPTVAREHNIKSVPSFFVYKDGVQVESLTGVQSAASLNEAISRHAYSDELDT